MSAPNPPSPLWPEHWAVQAAAEAEKVRNQLAAATARTLTAAEAASRAAVERHLAQVGDACTCTGRRHRRSRGDRWRGTSVERAYLHLHAARVSLVDLLAPEEIDALVPDVVTRLAAVLDRNDPRRVAAEAHLRDEAGPGRRAVIKQAMSTAYDASDEQYVRLRDFRNIVLLTALAMALLTAALVTAVALFPHAIPMCFKPGVTTAPGGEQAAPQLFSVCPSGDQARQQPTSADILIVAGLGAIGGAVGALVAIRNLRGTSTPYSVSTALAILKGPSGALSAIIGMVLLAGGFVPGLTNLDSQRQILAYALIFGIAQQLVTRVADDRAQQLLNQLPSKDPVNQPAQPAPATPVTRTAGQAPPPGPAPASPPGRPDGDTGSGAEPPAVSGDRDGPAARRATAHGDGDEPAIPPGDRDGPAAAAGAGPGGGKPLPSRP